MALIALLALSLPLDVITVGSGPFDDYSKLPAAVAAAKPGDTLILSQGAYRAPLIDKPLNLVGADPSGQRPFVSKGSIVITGPGPVTIQGIDFTELTIDQVAGKVRLDAIEHVSDFGGRLKIKDCPDVLMSRCTFMPPVGVEKSVIPQLRIDRSSVTIVDSALKGWNGWDDPFYPDNGSPAIQAGLGHCDLLLANTTAIGGQGGSGGWGSSDATAIDGPSGPGNTLAVEIRGTAVDEVSSTSFAAVQDWTSMEWSGATLSPAPLPTKLPFATPSLSLGKKVESGGSRELSVFGPIGAPCQAYFSTASANIEIPGVSGGPILLDPASIIGSISLVLKGQNVASRASFRVPTDRRFVGKSINVQAVVTSSLGPVLTNVNQIVLQA